ncbi:MAG: septation protein A [Hyphomicrobiaceae bacterium]|nr:septation protein A [Hyphomicrobiaceae bacterium]
MTQDGETPTGAKSGGLMKFALELGPLVLFFLANARGAALMAAVPALSVFGQPIFFATAVFMVAILAALVASKVLFGKVPVMPLVSGVVVLVFGALTLILQDDLFIKLKPTIVNLLFAGLLLGGLAFGRSLIAIVFGDAFRLTDEGWRKLTLRWGLFFVFLAALNEAVWRTQTTDFWVAFKVWGMMPITLVFAMSQMPLLLRHAVEDDEAGDEKGENVSREGD